MRRFASKRHGQRTTALITMAVTVVVAVAWYFLAYQPARENVTRLDADMVTLQGQVDRALRARERLPEVEADIERLQRERTAFLAELPTQSDVSGLVVQLRAAATRSGVAVTRLAQGTVAATGAVPDVRTLGFTLDTRGRYASTMAFLGELEALERYARIDEIRLSRVGDAVDPLLDASFRVSVFVFTGTDPGANLGAAP